MITLLSFASVKKENELLKGEIRIQAAKRTDEFWDYQMYEKLEQVREYLLREPVLDLISWDLTAAEAVKSLEDMRKQYRHAYLMVIADSSISPMVYLRPGIMPSSLLLKPLSREQVVRVVDEMMEEFTGRFERKDAKETFVIDTKEGKQYIPFEQIYYLEAREKKLYVRTRQEEYGFYATMEAVEKQLPKGFCRCHRSYIVNMEKVKTVKSAQNLMELKGDIQIPLSRSHKKAVKEFFSKDD